MQETKIYDITKHFKNKNEWLLIQVTSFNKKKTLPLKGRLLAHSKDCGEIERLVKRYKGLKLIIHTDERLPKGYAAAFKA